MKKEQIIAYFNSPKRLKKNFISRYYWKEITDYLSYFCHKSSSILEVGCGTGDLLAALPGSNKTGVDFSDKQIEVAKKKYAHLGIEFVLSDIMDYQTEKKFDIIILSNLVGFTDDIQELFKKIHGFCHEHTRVIVQYYNHFWEPMIKLIEFLGIKPKTPIQNWLSLRDINNLLYLSQFDVYRTSRRFVFPIYIPFISALFNKYLAQLFPFRYFGLNIYSFARPLPQCFHEHTREYSVSIVIPAKNESGNIENAILRMPRFGSKMEIIFIEGNSTDNTWEVIQEVQKKYSSTHNILIGRQKGKGKADAVREGFKMATGDILMILDADLTVPPEDLPKFYEAIKTGKGEFINGTRLVYPMEKEAMRFLNYLGNIFFSWMFTWLLGQRFKDTLCGTKVMFRKDYLRLVENRSYFGEFDPFGDFDLLFGAHKLNLKMVEVPIRYRERTYGETNISRFRHGWILLRMCVFAMRKCKFI
ncbi:MAG: bifunctional class I SAM-dependent methyltransferase/glycosyltransferase family 2 protein [Bacteroidia bacterium]|nr:bifunctional class I SAM-dependent methyltransferase/glycosyltransferase family 2 protein [Bacteroidia bacterium]